LAFLTADNWDDQ
jgi:hypothetical protein